MGLTRPIIALHFVPLHNVLVRLRLRIRRLESPVIEEDPNEGVMERNGVKRNNVGVRNPSYEVMERNGVERNNVGVRKVEQPNDVGVRNRNDVGVRNRTT